MSKKFYIETMVVHLEKLRELASILGFDHYFISEIDHMISTVKANGNESYS